MRKIIFFENKVARKDNYSIDFAKYEKLETVFGDEKCNKVLDDFLEDNSMFDQYDTILIHATIYYENKRPELFRTLKEYCKNKISLVMFSGGGDIGSLNNNILEVTAKSFYENIEIFLEKYQNDASNLLMLAYGENWDLNMLLNILEKLNILIEDNNDEKDDFVDFVEFDSIDDFKVNFDFTKIKKVLNIDEYKSIFNDVDIYDYEINISQIKTIRDNLENLIQDKANG